ncbi:UTP--glucose-1-phosphate uridylyltransferase GalU [Inquilinus sp. Marseille-Q2685]|uniref:UTP--glucose-1-phosphate uridylyltransferase GalU n=1 Tax=Inquilinus sp. Marseille-Q2685 TaxID=2866581 RepID=UPI001CE4A9B0|nr:UTP--glucose-1-phosphate uridylyltransferase GalU [Inquilinus sp. Marseille-Q2685]
MSEPVKVAVFPVAGLGTRSLPATKAVPKEMLCVVDKPVLQYAVEEAKAAGIEEFVFVSSRGKTALEDHFDENAELYATLEARKKAEQLKAARDAELPPGQFSFVRQAQPLGLGHAVWCARHLVGNRPFAVLLPDEIFKCRTPLLAQMVQAYGAHGGNLIAVREVPKELTSRYGILAIGQDDGTVAEVTGLVEKPKPEDAPSDLSVVGRYILQPEVFSHLDRQERGAGGEIQLTDAMARLIGSQPFHGVRFEGDRFDCGDKVGFIAANLAYGLDRPDLSAALREAVARYL